MSSNRNKNFRRRSDADNANGDDKTITTTTTNTKPQTVALASKPKSTPKPKPKPPDGGPKRLSFAEDEEEDKDSGPASLPAAAVRLPAATNSIHKLSISKNRSSSGPAPSIPSNVQPQAGKYTKERLLELQKNARTLGSLPKPQKPEPPAEPVIVLKINSWWILTSEDKVHFEAPFCGRWSPPNKKPCTEPMVNNKPRNDGENNTDLANGRQMTNGLQSLCQNYDSDESE